MFTGLLHAVGFGAVEGTHTAKGLDELSHTVPTAFQARQTLHLD